MTEQDKQLQILLVEDNPVDVSHYQSSSRDLGYPKQFACDGRWPGCR